MKTREALEQFKRGLNDNPDWARSQMERQRLVGAVWAVDQILGWIDQGAFDDLASPPPRPKGKRKARHGNR